MKLPRWLRRQPKVIYSKGADLGTASSSRSSEYTRAMVFVYPDGTRWAIIHRGEGPTGKAQTSITPIRGRTRRPDGMVVNAFDHRWMHEVDADD